MRLPWTSSSSQRPILHPHYLAVHVPVGSDSDMPRRPRPVSRKPPQNAIISPVNAKPAPPVSRGIPGRQKPRGKPQPAEAESDESLADSDSNPDSEEFFERGSSGAGPSSSGAEEDELGEDGLEAGDEAEPDAPRTAQWVDDAELDEVSEEESEGSEDEDAHKSRLVCLSHVFQHFPPRLCSFSKQVSSLCPWGLCKRRKRL